MQLTKKIYVFVLSVIIFMVFKCYNSVGHTSSTDFNFWLDTFTKSPVIVKTEERSNLGLNDLIVATFISKNHFAEALFVYLTAILVLLKVQDFRKCCYSFMEHSQLKNTTFVAYLTEDVDFFATDIYSKVCPVAEIKRINISTWPIHTQNLENYQFKAIYQSIALQNHKLLLTVDSSVRFSSKHDFIKMIKLAIKRNLLDATLLSKPNPQHSIYAVTDKRMFKYFPQIDIDETKTIIEYQAGLVLWIGSKSGWRIMKRYVECALIPDCMAPEGTSRNCDIEILINKPLEYANCHRYDQSALNLILLEESGLRPSEYQFDNSGFSFERF